MKLIFGPLEMARQNLARYKDARLILKKIEGRVSPWVRIPDEELPKMVPPPEVPRAYNTSFDGCPVHGMELFKFGNYSWIMDPFKRPWKLKCPIGGEEYPSNDFQEFLGSGMRDGSLLTGDYPDDGWGWRRPGDAHAHWFVAYYCHWYWYNHLIPAVLDLSRAYHLTEKDIYGRKCLILLDRIAKYYPRMDYNKQSRYAKEFRPEYYGKIVNLIWETNVIRSLAESVANIRDCLETEMPSIVGKNGQELAEFFDKRILFEGLRGIREQKIVGNYGMHQDAMLVILKALGSEAETKRGLEFLLDNPGGGYYHQGIRYAMDNFIYREGVSYENAPGYCFTWSRNLLSIATHLRSMGAQFPEEEKLKRMLEAPNRIVCLGRFTPAIGDSGSVNSGKIEVSGRDAARAFRMFPSPLFARWVRPGFPSYEDLFLPPITEELKHKRKTSSRKKSDCLGGYGLVILRTKGLECSMFYGRRNGHGHHDRLGIELFGSGRRLTPDLGYPQFASESKNPPAWERNTISHNTVTVNERKQDTGSAGFLRMFHSGRFVQAAEASANRTYEDAKLYLRTIALIGQSEPFFVDIFRVRGGFAHDYSIHGFEGKFSAKGVRLKKRPGTLAGRNVPYGYLYDDQELEKPHKERSYYSYRGSGFSYLYNLRLGKPTEPWWAQWMSEKAGLRIFFPHLSQEAVVASGNPPLKPGNPRSLRYVILRNRGRDLETVFSAVGETSQGTFRISYARPVKVESTEGSDLEVGIIVRQGNMRHLILSSTEPGTTLRAMGVEFKGRFLVLSLADNNKPQKLFMEGELLRFGDLEVRAPGRPQGQIIEINPQDASILVDMGDLEYVKGIIGETAFIENERRSSSFKILAIKHVPKGLYITLEDKGRIGRLLAERVGRRKVRTETKLLFADHGYYEGARLVDANHGSWLTIDEVIGDMIQTVEPLGDFPPGEAYVWEFGPSDRVSIAAKVEMEIRQGRWMGQSNLGARISQGSKTREVRPGRFTFRPGR